LVSNKSRTYNSIVNSLFGILASIITVIMNFGVRVIIVRELGEEINGLHNLFQSITNVITLMEMGISTAMIIHLYKPVKEENQQETKAIMSFYRVVYVYIAIAFTMLCLLIDLFLIDKLVTSTIAIDKVRLYFGLYALSFSINFLTYHKRSLLFAEQKNRISIGVTAACELGFRTLQIISVLAFHQYVLFLCLLVCEKVTSNAICAWYVNKHHPYLKGYNCITLEKRKQKAIFKTVKPLFVNQIASTVQKSANSILVSLLLGNVSNVGYYGNYQLVSNTAELLFSQFGAAFTSSFGNLAVEGNRDRMHHVYMKSSFVMNSIAVILCAGFLACIQDFIYLVFGKDFLLDPMSVIILTLNMLVYLFNVPVISVQNAMGLHKKDEKLMVVQAIVAVMLGYMLGKHFGMPGIFLGLLIPLIIFTLIMKGMIINKAVFETNYKQYLGYLLKEISKATIIIAVVALICLQLSMEITLLSLIAKAIIAVVVGIIFIIAMWARNIYMKECYCRIVGMIQERRFIK